MIKTSPRLISSFAAMCVGVFSYAAGLSESVCYIRESSNTSLNCDNLANALQNKSYISAAKKVRNYSGGESFGSGFVIKDEKGKLVVVTNKHVVDDAKFVDLTFEKDGAEVKYARCPVVFVSKNLDIALVNFPSDEVKVPALKISKDKIKDGSDVWTAGFPALGDKPSWQLGKGVVSNNSVKDEFFGSVDSVAIYQHTAQVDPGSSGGPLLIKDKMGDYTVVGINTWKAAFRENANFSIPIKYFNSVSANETSAASSAHDDSNEVEKVAKQFLEDVKKKDADLSSFVATEMLFGMDEPTVSTLLDKASDTRRVQLRMREPIPVMKSIVGDYVFNGVKSMDDVEYSSTVKDGDTYKTIYTYKGKEIEVAWKETGGDYRIVSSSSSSAENVEKIKKAGESKVIYSQEWRKYFEVGFSKGFSEIHGKKLDFSFISLPRKCFLYGVIIEIGHVKKHKYDDSYVYVFYEEIPDDYENLIFEDPTYVVEKEPYLEFSGRIGTQCPFKLSSNDKFFVSPYVIGDVGLVYTSTGNCAVSLHGGIKFGYTIDDSRAIFIGTECSLKRVTQLDIYSGDDDGCDFQNRKFFNINIGYGF